MTFDTVLRPRHYIGRRYEAWQIAEDWSLGFHLGNVLKYVIRCDHKGAREQDLEKALAYLRRLGDQAEILRHVRTVAAPIHTIDAADVATDYELTRSLAYAVHHIQQVALATDPATARKHVVLAAQYVKDDLGLLLVASRDDVAPAGAALAPGRLAPRPPADEATPIARPAGAAEDSAPRVERDERENTNNLEGVLHAAAG